MRCSEHAAKRTKVHRFAARFRVLAGSVAAGRAVRDVLWPADVRLTLLERADGVSVLDGNAVLREGDLVTAEGEAEENTLEELAELLGERADKP